MKRACELCAATARIYCEPDDASLCWNCDADIHSANFLVARHSRNLLCHVCQSPTPWSASGSMLVATAVFCLRCADGAVCGNVDEVEAEEVEDRGASFLPEKSESCSSTPTDELSDEDDCMIDRLRI